MRNLDMQLLILVALTICVIVFVLPDGGFEYFAYIVKDKT